MNATTQYGLRSQIFDCEEPEELWFKPGSRTLGDVINHAHIGEGDNSYPINGVRNGGVWIILERDCSGKVTEIYRFGKVKKFDQTRWHDTPAGAILILIGVYAVIRLIIHLGTGG